MLVKTDCWGVREDGSDSRGDGPSYGMLALNWLEGHWD